MHIAAFGTKLCTEIRKTQTDPTAYIPGSTFIIYVSQTRHLHLYIEYVPFLI